MKSLSHMGGVRIPYNQAKEIFKNGRGKQFSIYRERIYDRGPGKWILAFRVTKDCGNVAYKDFFEQVAVPGLKERNEIFAFTRATAEKVGDIIEFWLGVLDIASMAKGVIDVFDDHIDPTEYLNGLEKALTAFGSMAMTTFTTNDKRRGSFDCTLQTPEAGEVMTIIDTIPEYESLTNFDCMTAWEKQQVIEKFRKKYNITDDVDMDEEDDAGDEANDELGQGLSAPPDEPEAEEPTDADAEAARASERSGKQFLLDALGDFFTASEDVNVWIYCGSTKHTHDECEDPKRADIKRALDAVRAALEGESSGSDVDMEQEGEKMKEEPDKADESKGPAEPDTARTGEYHWYDDSRLMSEVGDLDEQGRFCIDGRDIVCEGPMTSYDLNEVIRDAIMRGGGDIWKVPEFLAAYTDKNTRKPLYKRVEAPMDGFLKIVPNTGYHFFNYKFYSGVEYGVDYRFGQRNKLSDYEDQVSSDLNRILRHHIGRASEPQSLPCDDAGWVPIMMCFRMKPFGGTKDWGGLMHTWFPVGKKEFRKIGTSKKKCSGCRRSSRSCSTVPGTADVFVNRCSRLVSSPTLIGTVQPVSVTVYRPPLTSLRKDWFCILSRWELLRDMATFVETTTSSWSPHYSHTHWHRAQ